MKIIPVLRWGYTDRASLRRPGALVTLCLSCALHVVAFLFSEKSFTCILYLFLRKFEFTGTQIREIMAQMVYRLKKKKKLYKISAFSPKYEIIIECTYDFVQQMPFMLTLPLTYLRQNHGNIGIGKY